MSPVRSCVTTLFNVHCNNIIATRIMLCCKLIKTQRKPLLSDIVRKMRFCRFEDYRNYLRAALFYT